MCLCGLSPEDLVQLEAWAAALDKEQLVGSNDAVPHAALLRRVLAAAAAGRRAPAAGASLEEPRQEWTTAREWRAPLLEEPAAQTAHAPLALDGPGVPGTATGDFLLATGRKEPFRRCSRALVNVVDTEPRVLHFNDRWVLRTRIGNRLMALGVMHRLLMVMAVLLLLVSVFTPLSSTVSMEYIGVEGNELEILRPGLFTWLVQDIGFTLFWFGVLHYVHLELFVKVLFTFDTIVIMSSFLLGESAHFYNMYAVWGAHYDTEWKVLDIVRVLVVALPVGVAVSALDSFKASREGRFLKVCLSSAATLFFVSNVVSSTVGPKSKRWPNHVVHVGMFSTIPHAAFKTAEGQKVLFLGKAIARYAMGFPFAFIKPNYVWPAESDSPVEQEVCSESDSSEGSEPSESEKCFGHCNLPSAGSFINSLSGQDHSMT